MWTSAPASREKSPPSSRAVPMSPRLDVGPRSYLTRAMPNSGWLPVTDSDRASDVTMVAMVQGPALPASFAPASGLTMRRV